MRFIIQQLVAGTRARTRYQKWPDIWQTGTATNWPLNSSSVCVWVTCSLGTESQGHKLTLNVRLGLGLSIYWRP